jgi:hypothetical protein
MTKTDKNMAISTLCPTPGFLDLGLASISPVLLASQVSSREKSAYKKTHVFMRNDTGVGILVASAGTNKPSRSSFLSLPVEIRLQIYDWVYRMSPVQKQKHLAYPIPTIQPRFTKLVDNDQGLLQGCVPRLLRQDRFYNYVPSNLLSVSRQVYMEAREIPFHGNEFVFENWFSSGLVTASTMLTDVFEPWQTRAMRFARIEMRETDWRNHGGLDLWAKLSTAWSGGLHGLRVLIQMPSDSNASGDEGIAESLDRLSENWVANGILAEFEALEKLEIELVTPPSCSDMDKLAWCGKLQEMLRDRGSSAAVVLCQRKGLADDD